MHSGQEEKPKPNIKTQYMHHSLIQSLQTIWSIRNIDNIVTYTICRFKIKNNEETFSAVCVKFELASLVSPRSVKEPISCIYDIFQYCGMEVKYKGTQPQR